MKLFLLLNSSKFFFFFRYVTFRHFGFLCFVVIFPILNCFSNILLGSGRRAHRSMLCVRTISKKTKWFQANKKQQNAKLKKWNNFGLQSNGFLQFGKMYKYENIPGSLYARRTPGGCRTPPGSWAACRSRGTISYNVPNPPPCLICRKQLEKILLLLRWIVNQKLIQNSK